MTLNINIKLAHPRASAPSYANPGDACFDLRAILDSGPVTIEPGKAEAFSTGLVFEIPLGYVLKVYSRSGHGFKNGVRLANSVGVLDAGYRGILMVKLHNDGPSAFVVNDGDRIAQGMVEAFPQVSFTVAETLSETARGAGGLGSTGVA
jgi:dUTP pyrophosphatase